MKLIVQADDFAMTDAVAEGILKAARDGILTQTGLMTCGPHAQYYAQRIMHECPHIALGQEINLVSGRPVSNPEDIPTLVNPDGTFIRSRVHKDIDLTDPHHTRYEEAYKEIEAQYLKFRDLVGHQPYFFGLHSYHNAEMMQAMADVQKKYSINGLEDTIKSLNLPLRMGPWYPLNNMPTENGLVKNDKKEVLSLDYQFSFDAKKMFFEGKCGYITDHVKEKDTYTMLHTHAGFIDRDLLDMSTLTMTRVMELDLLCCDEMKKWIKDNDVQLVNFRDIAEGKA